MNGVLDCFLSGNCGGWIFWFVLQFSARRHLGFHDVTALSLLLES